jgi:hypothetical protein
MVSASDHITNCDSHYDADACRQVRGQIHIDLQIVLRP